MARYYEIAGGKSKVTEIEPKVGGKFALKEAQTLVGGYVELVRLNDDNIMLLDEEGLLKSKEINLQAMRYAHQLGWMNCDILVGDVLFLKDNEF